MIEIELNEEKNGLENNASLVVEMINISKSFGEVKALNNVSFTLHSGEVRALVGENGAGKTTLMNILYGMYSVDEGEIKLWGKEIINPWSPRESIKAGIGMIHQHFALIPNHTVLENIVMPMLRWSDILPDWENIKLGVKKICEDYHFQIDLQARVEDLSMGERQQVEIMKALYQGAKTLILDEPTSILTPQQIKRLLNFLLVLKKQGHSVIIVTHKLDEAMEVSDRITVLRNGEVMGTLEKNEATPQKIARMMIDRDWVTELKAMPLLEVSPVIFRVENLSLFNEQNVQVLDDLSLYVRAGEIVGIAGVAGNGQVELAETLVGLRKTKNTMIEIEGKNITKSDIRSRRHAGIVYIPEDRHSHGVVLDMTIAENIILNMANEAPYARWGLLQQKKIDSCANEAISSYNIKTPGSQCPVGNLSGGNQQKIVLARAMIMDPKLIIACQPTRGLDFNATEYVRTKLLDSANKGIGVILISSDLDEILELSHRILVIFKGKIIGEFKRNQVDIEELGLLMVGHKK